MALVIQSLGFQISKICFSDIYFFDLLKTAAQARGRGNIPQKRENYHKSHLNLNGFKKIDSNGKTHYKINFPHKSH